MLIRLIAKIRQKPKHVKDKVALAIAGTFTFIVFSFWAYNLPNTFNPVEDVAVQGENKAFSEFFGEFSDQMASVKEAFSSTEEGLSETSVASTSDEVLTDTVRDYVDKNNSSSNLGTTSQPQEVRIVTVKSTTSSSTQEAE